MTNSPDIRAALAHVALNMVPPLIRETLIEDPDFRHEHSMKTEAIISFGDSNPSFQRRALFDAIRTVMSGTQEIEVIDSEDQAWKLKDISEAAELTKLTLSRDKQSGPLPDFCALSPVQAIRLRSFDEAASDVNLPGDARDQWHGILEKRALGDDEWDDYQNEFCETPVYIARSIRSDILAHKNIQSMVPSSIKYFERLVGAYNGSGTIQDYVANGATAVLDQLSAWHPDEGFLFSLFLSAHSSLTAEINVDQLSNKDLVRNLGFLEKDGDRLSQLGAIEVGLRVLSSKPEIETMLIRLVEQIRDDDVSSQTSGFKLLSSAFLFVDGTLSRTRMLSTMPPFYRRLAALSQAAVIQRQFVNSRINGNSFQEWALNQAGQFFYLQSLTDMRIEPRCSPDPAAPSQMKAEFFGRIMIAASNQKENIKSSKIVELILGAKSGSLYSLSDSFSPFLPGPLDGAEESQNLLPLEMAETIETQLNGKEVTPSSFTALVNSALLFGVGTDKAELAAKALKLSSHRLANIEDRSQLLAVLYGLAKVSAIARNHSLADELRILVRRYRHDAQYSLTVEETVTLCLMASASRAGLKDWREFAGDWLTELAFSDLEDDDGEALHSHLKCLCCIVPELWVSVGRADAALKAFNASRHAN